MKMKKLITCLLLILIGGCFLSIRAARYYFRPLSKPFDDIARRFNQLDQENRRSDMDSADLTKLDALAGKQPQLRARSLYWHVRMNQIDAQPEKCIQLLRQARRLCQPGYDYDQAVILYQLAGNYERLGKYLLCYTYCRQAIPVFTKVGDHFFLGNTYLLLVQMYLDIDDKVSARQNLVLAKEHYQKAAFPLNRIYFFESMLTDNIQEKMKLDKKSIASGANDWALTIQVYADLSELQLATGHPLKATAACDTAFRILKNHQPDNIFFRCLLSISRAKIFYHQKEYARVISLLESLKPMAGRMEGEKFMQEVYHYLWLSYDRLGEQQKAYSMLVYYQQEYERNTEILRSRDVSKAQARDEILRQNDRMKLLEKDAQLKTNYFYLVLLAFILVVIIGVALAFYFRQRYRFRKLENEQLRETLRQEALIYSVNRKNFEEDIRKKECEISSNTLLLANKNEVLKQISDITNKFSEEGMIPRSYVQQVNRVIGESLKNDDEWSRFKLHFDAVHPNFFVRLKEICQELTENDLRLCAYICIGIRPKQIAEMLSVSPDSVNSNRYRLRKKFGLQRNESLDDFIRKVGK